MGTPVYGFAEFEAKNMADPSTAKVKLVQVNSPRFLEVDPLGDYTGALTDACAISIEGEIAWQLFQMFGKDGSGNLALIGGTTFVKCRLDIQTGRAFYEA